MRSRTPSGPASLLLALAALAAGCFDAPPPPLPAEADPATRRSPPAGELVGKRGRYGSHAWLGIPYARPPVGPLRWRAPQPLPPWQGTRNALAFGPACPQYASRIGGVDAPRGSIIGDEDCLTLSVWVPPFAPDAVPAGDARLPVMLWIHGGGNSIGTHDFYDGGHLATRHDLVVVAVNYRLGPLGWFRHAALRGEGTTPEDRSGNYGTLDHVRALTWVRDNIAAFGGDPDRVTVFGESAGARNTLNLMLSPKAEGLFQRAIVQSGGVRVMRPARAENRTDAEDPGVATSSGEIVLRLLQAEGVTGRDGALARLAGMDDARLAAWLRERTPAQLLGAYDAHEGTGMIDFPQIFGDGAVMPRGDALAHFGREGGYHPVPAILGTNRDENKLFMVLDPLHADLWFGLLPWLHDEQVFEVTARYRSRMWKATGADEPARRMRTVQGPSVWVYRFDWDEEPAFPFFDLGQLLGAAHGFEVPFVFGHFDLGRDGNTLFTAGNREGRLALAGAMMSYWAEFAYAGVPGRGRDGDLPAWQPFHDAPEVENTLVLDTPRDGGVRMERHSERAEALLAELREDSRLETLDRCRLFRDFADDGRGFDRRDYAALRECAAYPFETFPWQDGE